MLWLLSACFLAPAPPPALAPCTTLDALSVEDPWALPGTDEPGATDALRTRRLDRKPAWASRCLVRRLGGLDVGPSCVAEGLSPAEADALYGRLVTAFEGCHEGWSLSDTSDAETRELLAERGPQLRFVRARSLGERGWEVSIGAMPVL